MKLMNELICLNTLKEISKDFDKNLYMTESNAIAVDFDKTMATYKKKYFNRCKFIPSSVDALVKNKKGDYVFIEFKNGSISDKDSKNEALTNDYETSIRNKINDSILLFNDILGLQWSECRDSLNFCLVYNELKNSSIQYSKSYELIAKNVAKNANNEIVYFGLSKYRGVYFKEIHTYTEEEFEEAVIKNDFKYEIS